MTDVSGWACPPIDDVGYVSSAEMLTWSDERLRNTVSEMERTRYSGWRNWENRWRDALRLDHTHGQLVMDYGCGVGVEALQYTKSGNEVILVDVIESNVQLAERVLGLFGHRAFAAQHASTLLPFIEDTEPVDVVHMSGVLHHVPEPRPLIERLTRLLRRDGQLRLMLYSDEGWRIACNTEPPVEVQSDRLFTRFLRFFDAVGWWADWYDRSRLEARFGDLFEVRTCDYLTQDRRYLGAVLVKR